MTLLSRLLRRLGLVPAPDFSAALDEALRRTDPVTLGVTALERAVRMTDSGADGAGRFHPSQED